MEESTTTADAQQKDNKNNGNGAIVEHHADLVEKVDVLEARCADLEQENVDLAKTLQLVMAKYVFERIKFLNFFWISSFSRYRAQAVSRRLAIPVQCAETRDSLTPLT